MPCPLFRATTCRSCQWLDKPYTQQLDDKQQHLKNLLAGTPVKQWYSPVAGEQYAFRNKAKMVVSGSVERPLLGMLHRDGTAVDLCHCPLYPTSFAPVLTLLKQFIQRAGLTPYNVARKRGELKYLLLTESRFNSTLMLRFVLRSERKLPQLRAALPWLQQQLPLLTVISANIQPVHMAIQQGEQEIVLTEQQVIEERLNQIPLFIRPQSFFQTHPQVASALYATARDWVRELHVTTLWDLFCGVGGFALHCVANNRMAENDGTDNLNLPPIHVTGIEIEPQAIAAAQRSATLMGLGAYLEFQALDATRFAQGQQQVPQLVIVNPPRRGIGSELCDYLNTMAPPYLLYSSCQAETMANDITALKDYRIERVQLFDMFPHTTHYEVLALLVNQHQQDLSQIPPSHR